MSKIILPNIAGGYNLQAINSNFASIAEHLNTKVYYRDNPGIEVNTMITDVDMNGKRLYNLPAPTLPSEAARLQDIASGGYTLPVATVSVLGGVKQGANVTIAGDGTISVSAGGTGTVTSASVVSANGFGGSVATATTTPAITLTTSVSGLLKGNGTLVSAAINSDLPVMSATVGGAVPTPPNNTTTFLRGDGTFATPSGSGDMVLANVQTVTGAKTFGAAGNVGKLIIAGTTSGTTVLNATAVAGSTTLTLPAVTDTLVAKTTTDTLTNKRVNPRFTTAANYTTSTTIDSDANDVYIVTAQAGALLFNNPTGTPVDGQALWIAVTGTAARALTWGTAFEASTVALPTTTVTTARLDMGFMWRADTSKWRIVGAA
jgi:hypothetical protein